MLNKKYNMKVLKRNGNKEEVSFDKVIKRLKSLKNMEPVCEFINVILIAQKVVGRIYDGVTTSELDELSARICTSMVTIHPDYLILASRIIISNIHKNTSPSFSETIHILYNNVDIHNKKCGLIADDVYTIVMKNKNKLNDVINYNRDYKFNYFGYKTLEKAYLLKIGNKIIERPQHMIMRVSLGIHKNDIKSVIRCYNMMSMKYFTHATPTLFHSGTPRSQFLSCFLLGIEDSVQGIYKCISDCAMISKWSGGIGIHISNIRSKDSLIRKTNGKTDGIVPMLKVFNDTACYINQSGRRAGSFAIYLSPWHYDIEDFLDLKKNHGDEKARARDLFYALWVSDLFFERVEADGEWCLFDPDECPKLDKKYGNEFKKAYKDYESTGLKSEGGLVRKKIKAQDLWRKIVESQIETGTPYICSKDASNKKTNQKNVGVIKSSNLCSEIIEYSDAKETACCLTADTKVLTKNGIKNIIDCDNEQVLVPVSSDNDLIYKESYEYAKLLNKGKKDVYEISFKGLPSIKATKDHKFIQYLGRNYNKKINKLSWINVEDIKTGHKLYLPNTKCLETYKNITKDELDMEYATIGWMIGDGWFTETSCGAVFCIDEILAQEKVKEQFNNWKKSLYLDSSGDLITKRLPTGYYKESNISVCEKDNSCSLMSKSKKLRKFLNEKFGLEPKYAKNKIIPEKIKKNGTPKQIASILSGLFSADGCCCITKKSGYVEYSSASYNLLVDIHTLLKCFGIHSRIYFKEVRTRPGRFQGKVSVAGPRNLKLFKKHIGFVFSECKDRKLSLVDLKKRVICYDYGVVENIKHIGVEPVYDLALQNKHVFIANGIATHNCTLASLTLPSYLELPKMAKDKIMLFTKKGCSYCDLAKMLVKRYKLNFEIIDLSDDDKRMIQLTILEKQFNIECKTMPQIVIGNEYLGGYTELEERLRYKFNFKKLHEVIQQVVINLDNIIDLNFYPTPETKLSNMRHRPLGIGVTGLADVYALMRYPFDSKEAHQLNKKIFATMYHGALTSSLQLAKERGKYSTFDGSPLSKGKFQFDLWEKEPEKKAGDLELDWEGLRKDIMKSGTRNSLLLCCMPSASTSNIMGVTECIEPFTSNLYVRRVLSGDFLCINRYLLKDLLELGLWQNKDLNIKEQLLYFEGEMENLTGIPNQLKKLYKTSYELSMKTIIDQSAERGIYVDQSQSLNLFIRDPTLNKVTSALYHGWRSGLKTLVYYLRTKSKIKTQQFTLDVNLAKEFEKQLLNKMVKEEKKKEEVTCTSCSA